MTEEICGRFMTLREEAERRLREEPEAQQLIASTRQIRTERTFFMLVPLS